MLWASGGYEVSLYDVDKEHQKVMTLQPAARNLWGEKLSICQHPQTGAKAVVGCRMNTLDIYDHTGQSFMVYVFNR